MTDWNGTIDLENAKLKVNFEVIPGSPGDFAGRSKFWGAQSTRKWFQARGYTLYKRLEDENYDIGYILVPSVGPSEGAQAKYPYAHYDLNTCEDDEVPLRVMESGGKVFFAQDSLLRHVAIKVVQNDTEELKILHFLRQQDLETLEENCIMPVLDIFPVDGFSFVVMPRWGGRSEFPCPQQLHGVLTVMHSMLKALNFLHAHNITHRDINSGNILVNHFGDDYIVSNSDIRNGLRSKGLLTYAMFDFDHSIMLSPEDDRTQFRLPYYKSWGSINVTFDTAQGEFEFNPFVTDVGALGRFFCAYYQYLSKYFPIFAPFLDRLTTRNLVFRFTASEALTFFEETMLPFLAAAKDQPIPHDISSVFVTCDRWATASPEFAQKWALYREPSLPWTTSILHRICRTSWGCHAVPRIRWFFFRLSIFPRRIVTYLGGLRVSERSKKELAEGFE